MVKALDFDSMIEGSIPSSPAKFKLVGAYWNQCSYSS